MNEYASATRGAIHRQYRNGTKITEIAAALGLSAQEVHAELFPNTTGARRWRSEADMAYKELNARKPIPDPEIARKAELRSQRDLLLKKPPADWGESCGWDWSKWCNCVASNFGG